MTIDSVAEKMEEFYNSTFYESIIAKIKLARKLDVADIAPEISYTIDKKKITAANLNIEELISEMKQNPDGIVNYFVVKFSALENEPEDQEYPENEPPEDEAESKPIRLPFYKNFLMLYMIEFYIIKNKPDYLLTYLKSIRIPHAAKYGKQIVGFYKKAVALP